LTGNNIETPTVVECYDDVAPHVADIVEASDANRDSLGFFPRSLFDDFARRGRLLALLISDGSGRHFAGHLLFQRQFPRASILQLYIAPEYRGHGYARILCNRIVEILTSEGFLSIYARVAEDLTAANMRWEGLGFLVQRVEPGGATTGRTIVVRVRELPSPQLFPLRDLDPGNPLGLKSPSTEIPLFLIDLNVLFDLGPRRQRNEEAIALFKAERLNFCRLAISDELLAELKGRSSGRTDPMLDLASTFTTFPVSADGDDDRVLQELSQIVFRHKSTTSKNDKADLRHLRTVITNNLAGLVTNDQKVLDAAGEIERRFGIQVLSSDTFLRAETAGQLSTAFEADEGALFLGEPSDSDSQALRVILTRSGVSAVELTRGWVQTRSDREVATASVVRRGSQIVGYMIWPGLKQGGTVVVRAVVEETASGAREVARALLTQCLEILAPPGQPSSIHLKMPSRQATLKEIALGLGFCAGRDSHDLVKVSLGSVVFSKNWNDCRSSLITFANLKLDPEWPSWRQIEQQLAFITPNADRRHLPLEKLETLLSPALFCLPHRPAVITPIEYKYAQRLLGHSPQTTLLPESSSNLFSERHFISSRNPYRYLTRGTLVVFYETHPPRGKGELIAIVRVRRSYLKSAQSLEESDFTRSVLTTETVGEIGTSDMKTVTVFDNLFPLPHPIPLERLQSLGCGRPNDLITTRPINDTQLQAILAEAFRRGR
jgi:ribosomal protein S18 acetylase RimI-like enzyme